MQERPRASLQAAERVITTVAKEMQLNSLQGKTQASILSAQEIAAKTQQILRDDSFYGIPRQLVERQVTEVHSYGQNSALFRAENPAALVGALGIAEYVSSYRNSTGPLPLSAENPYGIRIDKYAVEGNYPRLIRVTKRKLQEGAVIESVAYYSQVNMDGHVRYVETPTAVIDEMQNRLVSQGYAPELPDAAPSLSFEASFNLPLQYPVPVPDQREIVGKEIVAALKQWGVHTDLVEYLRISKIDLRDSEIFQRLNIFDEDLRRARVTKLNKLYGILSGRQKVILDVKATTTEYQLSVNTEDIPDRERATNGSPVVKADIGEVTEHGIRIGYTFNSTAYQQIHKTGEDLRLGIPKFKLEGDLHLSAGGKDREYLFEALFLAIEHTHLSDRKDAMYYNVMNDLANVYGLNHPNGNGNGFFRRGNGNSNGNGHH